MYVCVKSSRCSVALSLLVRKRVHIGENMTVCVLMLRVHIYSVALSIGQTSGATRQKKG